MFKEYDGNSCAEVNNFVLVLQQAAAMKKSKHTDIYYQFN